MIIFKNLFFLQNSTTLLFTFIISLWHKKYNYNKKTSYLYDPITSLNVVLDKCFSVYLLSLRGRPNSNSLTRPAIQWPVRIIEQDQLPFLQHSGKRPHASVQHLPEAVRYTAESQGQHSGIHPGPGVLRSDPQNSRRYLRFSNGWNISMFPLSPAKYELYYLS